MFEGIGFNAITIYAAAVTALGLYSFKKNITSGRVLREQVGADWKKYVKPFFSK